MKKKIVSALMVAAMVVTAFAGCGSDKGGTSTQGGDKTSKSSGKVYMLNFKPETDEAWQDLAETYTDQTGVEVNVLTAADGQYNTTLQSEMAKSDAPTIFNVGNSSAAQTWNRTVRLHPHSLCAGKHRAAEGLGWAVQPGQQDVGQDCGHPAQPGQLRR